jgi:glyoxylase-like metal-dependent hydrolase (beta-lactamase superfamily II)
MQIKRFVFNPFQENTYLVYDQTREALIIDAGCFNPSEAAEVKKFVDSNQLKVKYLVNTHCHIDHILGITALKGLFGCECLAHREDIPLLESAPTHALMFGLYIDEVPYIDRMVDEGEPIAFGDSQLVVIHTPGHTRGGICLYSPQDKALFAGDTLFQGSIGRTDLAGGSYDTLIESITKKILTLDDAVVVYPGHGESTTIGNERRSNPFLR